MQVRVKLPSGPLIHYWKFCREIAKAVCPIDTHPTGIDCVWAKSYPSGVPSPYAGTNVPFPLDEADRRALAKILPKLPPLKYPMSDEDAGSFMDAYAKRPDRPMWMPVLVTEETVLGLKIRHDQVMDRHIASIREEHRARRLVPVDANYVPLEAVQAGAFLTRKDAIAYLDRHGLAYDDEDVRKSLEDDVEPSTAVGKAILSLSDREAIPMRHAKLVADGVKNPTDLLAKEFGVSTRRIRTLVSEAKAMKLNPPPLSHMLVSLAKRG